jgi:predicted permease
MQGWLHKTLLRLKAVFQRNKLDRDLEEEVAFHLAMREGKIRRDGITPEEARYAARRQFGNATNLVERSREMWTFAPLETLWQDVRFGIRVLRKSPAFAAIAMLSLALAIGANATVFSLLDALLFRQLPVRQPGALVEVSALFPEDDGESAPLSLPMFREFSQRQQVFSGFFGWLGDGIVNVETNGSLSQADMWAVTGNLYSELGVSPFAGRLLSREDSGSDEAAPRPVAVLGYGFWKRHYGGDLSVLDKSIRIEGVPFSVVGIMRRGFTGLSIGSEPDVTIPLMASSLISPGEFKDRNDPKKLWISAAGRLRNGVTLEQARAQLEVLWPAVQSATRSPDFTPLEQQNFSAARLKVESIATGNEWFLRSHFTRPLYILMGVTGLILLIACANLASLTLARASARSQEITVRVALGASRARLVSQMFTESLLLSAAGAAVGILFAYYGSRGLVNFMMQDYLVPPALNINPDFRVIAFTSAVSILTGLLFGVAPAWRAARQDPAAFLKQNSRTLGSGTGSWGKLLVCSQVALSLALVMGASLFARSLARVRSIDLGFRTRNVSIVELFPIPNGYKDLHDDVYYPELIRRIASLPGVLSASFSNMRPGSIFGGKETVSAFPATEAKPDNFQAVYTVVSPEFFDTMGISLLEGRNITWNDNSHANSVAIISQNLAHRLFPSGNAIGREIQVGADRRKKDVLVVGLASNARLLDLYDPRALTIYVPLLQDSKTVRWGNLEVHTGANGAPLSAALRTEIESLGHEYPLRISTVSHEVDRTLLQERITAILSGFFGVLALVLAAIGLYGLMSYTVTRRTRELGIRAALGARRGEILQMVLRETLALSTLGVVIGVPCALVVTQFTAKQLYGLSAHDPATLVFVILLMLVITALAGYLPARRATRIDPMVALRHE